MKKIHQANSLKRTCWLQNKRQRAIKRKIIFQRIRTEYKRLRRINRTPQVALFTIKRHLSESELDSMGDALERMFAPKERVYSFSRY